MPVSISRHIFKSSDTLSKYGFEGCGVFTAGIEGLRATFPGDGKVVLQPVTLARNTSNVSHTASLTGGGRLCSFVHHVLTARFKTMRFLIRFDRGRCLSGNLKLLSIGSPLEVGTCGTHSQDG